MKATTYSVPPIDNGEALTEGSSGQLECAADLWWPQIVQLNHIKLRLAERIIIEGRRWRRHKPYSGGGVAAIVVYIDD